MRLLLDTHVFLWYITADPKLPATFRAASQDPTNEVYLSVASIWEAVIKCHLGNLPLPAPPADFLPWQREAHGIASLPIDEGAMSFLAGLLPIHRDPFDWLLVAQALQHGLTVATVQSTRTLRPIPSLCFRQSLPSRPGLSDRRRSPPLQLAILSSLLRVELCLRSSKRYLIGPLPSPG